MMPVKMNYEMYNSPRLQNSVGVLKINELRQGGSRIFKQRGSKRLCARRAHPECAARSPLRPGCRARWKMYRVLDALYLKVYCDIITKYGTQTNNRSKFRGGARLLRPLLIRHWAHCNLKCFFSYYSKSIISLQVS